MKKSLILIIVIASFSAGAQDIQLALMKYRGGGDWYSDPTALPNLIAYCNKTLDMNLKEEYATVEPGSAELFNYPLVHLTGHGNIVFSGQEADNLRKYLEAGGFLHIDDNYGLDKYIRSQMKKVFPEKKFVELPFEHPIYHQKFDFPEGPPKIHEHDGKAPQGLGIFHEGRLVCYYTLESDLGDGWEDPQVHKDPREKRLQALRMGCNIIQFVFMNR